MAAIPGQYSFGADKVVQISQAVFFIKGHNPNFDIKTEKSPYQSGYQVFFMNGSFGFKLSEKIILLYFLCKRNKKKCLEVMTLKRVIKVSA